MVTLCNTEGAFLLPFSCVATGSFLRPPPSSEFCAFFSVWSLSSVSPRPVVLLPTCVASGGAVLVAISTQQLHVEGMHILGDGADAVP